jgi:dUTP pyrophosphatase
MRIHFKQFHKDAALPSRATPGAAGLDLYSVEDATVRFGQITTVPTGVGVKLPIDYAGLIWPRSGLAEKHGVDVLAGVIDPDYKGEIKVVLTKLDQGSMTLPAGKAIAQLLLQECKFAISEWTDDLGESLRMDRGFGSSDW